MILLNFIPFSAYSGNDLTENWKNVDYFANYYYTSISCYDSLNCITSGNLYAGDGPVFRRTTDGGVSWHTIWADSSIFYFDSLDIPHYSYRPKYQVVSISLPGKELCLAGFTLGKMLRSTDNGVKWDSIYFKSNKAIRKISMYNTKFGVALNDTNILITHDGGLTWKTTVLPDTGARNRMLEIQTPSSDNIIVTANCVESGLSKYNIYKTSDNGKNWIKFEMKYYFRNIFFLNDSLGWSCGGYSISDTIQHYTYMFGRIYHTTNGGETWAIQLDLDDTLTKNNDLFYYISFSDSLNGIATNVLSIYRTYDGGKNWIRQTNEVIWGPMLELEVFYTSFKQGTAIVTGRYVKMYRFFENPDGVAEEATNNSNTFLISPNPAEDYIEISVGARHALPYPDIRIFNVFGEIVSTSVCSADTSASGGQRIDVSDLPSGMYFVRVGDKVRKFLKI